MIIVDEQLLGTGVIEGIDHWYQGRVLDITERSSSLHEIGESLMGLD